MNCSDVQEQLSAYHDRELSPEAAAQVAAHVAGCAACSDQLASFEQLSGLSRRLTDPPVPADLWEKLQSELKGTTHLQELLGRISPNRVTGRLLALAAMILVAAGIGVVSYKAWLPGAGSEHMTMDFADYARDFAGQPEAAQNILLASYNGRRASLSEVTQELGYKPVAARGLPAGYSVERAYLLDMPCCTCAQIICENDQGQQIAIFEHAMDQPVSFGDRPSMECMCQDVPTDVVQFGDHMAATWQTGQRHVTLIGATDLDEVAEFVESFKNQSDIL